MTKLSIVVATLAICAGCTPAESIFPPREMMKAGSEISGCNSSVSKTRVLELVGEPEIRTKVQDVPLVLLNYGYLGANSTDIEWRFHEACRREEGQTCPARWQNDAYLAESEVWLYDVTTPLVRTLYTDCFAGLGACQLKMYYCSAIVLDANGTASCLAYIQLRRR